MASRPIKIDIIGDDSQLRKVLKGAGDRVGAFAKKVGKIGVQSGKAMGAASAAVGVASTKMFMDFEQGMNEVFTLLPQAGQETFDELTRQTKQFSKQFGVLPDKVIPSLYDALSAGVPPDTVFSYLETAQKMARGGAVDLTEALDGLTTATNSWSSMGLTATEAADIFATTVRLGKTTVGEMSSELYKAGPIAAAAGVSFKDIGAAAATLTAQGQPTAQAMTAIKAALGELVKDGTKSSNALKEISGHSFQELLGQGKSLNEIFQLMAEGSSGSVIDAFGSLEAGAAVLALTSGEGKAFAANMAEFEASAGATDKAFSRMNQGLQVNFDKIKSNLAVLSIEIGTKIAPFVAKATDFMVKSFEKLGPFLKRARTRIEDLAASTRDFLIPVFERAREIFGLVADKVMAVWDAVYTYLAPGIKDLADKVTDLAERAFGKLRDIFNAINWGRVLEEIAAGFEAVRAKVMEFVRGIPDGFRSVVEWIKKNKEWIMILGGAVGGLVVGLAAYLAVTKAISAALKAQIVIQNALKIVMATSPVMLLVVAFAALAGALVVAYFRFEEVRNIVDSVGRFLRDTFLPTVQVVIDMVVDYFKFLWEQIKLVVDLVKAIFKGEWSEAAGIFKNLIKNAIDFVVGFFIKLPGRLLKALPPIILALAFIAKQFVIFLAEKVGKVISSIVDFFIGLPKRLLDAGVDIVTALFDMGVNWGRSIINAIVEGLRRAGGAISSFIMGLVPDVGSIVDSIVGGATSKAKSLVKSIIPGFAKGGVVTKPTLGLVGEAGPEAIIPLNRAGGMGTVVNINVSTGVGDPVAIGDEVVEVLTAWQRANGTIPVDTSAA